METKLSIICYNPKEALEKVEKENGASTVPFSVRDVSEFIIENEDLKDTRIMYISNHTGEIEDQKQLILDVVSHHIDSENTVIITDSYLSTEKYPPDKYFLDKREDGKEPIPVEEEFESQGKMLTEVGFLDLNFYTNYEYKVAYIYGNKIGSKILDIIRKSVEEFEKKAERNKE